jgi:predicted transcriptional regulator
MMTNQSAEQNEDVSHSDLLSLVGQIVSAYVSNNQVQADHLPGLIQQIYKSLDVPAEPKPVVAERPQPAVPIKRSVHPDYIVCLEDGAQLKMLKRYLQTRYNMTPEQYRERWGLGPDYPMVAPSYAEKRSTLAKAAGLGRKQTDASPKRGRPSKRDAA